MPEWRMLVWQPDGTARATTNVDGPIARLDRFDVSGSGNCLEASWVADPQAVTIKARDVIRLDAREEAADAWTSVYKGFVTIAGSDRAESLQDYRAVGLKQRFYEILLDEPVIDGADVATMVDAALTSLTLPEGVTYSSSDVPTLTFQLGDRLPALETVGDFLDVLADTVGRFIVPTGETYTYDGTTYNAGDIVPAVRWGTDADGAFFFRRPQASSVSVSEGEVGTLVRWERASGEEVYDSVTLVYASDYEGSPIKQQDREEAEFIAHPIAKTFGSGSFEATRRVTLDAPLDAMTESASSSFDSNVTNVSNAFDGDDSTFAAYGTDGNLALVRGTDPAPEGAIARVVFNKGNASENLTIDLLYVGNSGSVLASLRYSYEEADTGKRTIVLPAPWPADVLADDTATLEGVAVDVQVTNAQGLELYSLELFVPDDTVGQRLAETHEIDIEENASEVELVGQLGGVSQTMSLTPNGESATDMPIERIEYSLSTDDGLITRYALGQSFSADLISEKIVLDRLAKKQVTGRQQ